jgi:putative pyoverdin transport system ATP-binding/permease protein
MRLTRFLFRVSPAIFLLSATTSLISGLLSTTFIFSIIRFSSQPSLIGTSVAFINLAILAALMALTNLVAQASLSHLSEKAVSTLIDKLSERMLEASFQELEKQDKSSINALLENVTVLSNSFGKIPFLFTSLATIFFSFVYLITISEKLFFSLLIIMFFSLFIFNIFANSGRKYFSDARELQDSLFEHFRALTYGIKELKLHLTWRENFLKEHLQPTVKSIRNCNFNGNLNFSLASNWALFIIFLAIAASFSLAKYYSVSKDAMMMYALFIVFLIGPLEEVVSIMPTISKSSISLFKIESFNRSLVSQLPEILEAVNQNNNYDHDWSHIKLCNVTYSYLSDDCTTSFELGPINLEFERGKVIFIRGGNGSGKTSLLKLIVGLYSVDQGSIYIGDKVVNDHSIQWYREHFAVVFSDFYLFEHLLSAREDISRHTIVEYLDALDLHAKVTLREDFSFSTTALSQGQRKRLALLCAYLDNRPIYVFDEWAADQDPNFKEIFYTQILKDLKDSGKTIIAITHDEKFFDIADQVIVLDYGQVVDVYRPGVEPRYV